MSNPSGSPTAHTCKHGERQFCQRCYDTDASEKARTLVRNHERLAMAVDTLGASELGDAERAVLEYIAELETERTGLLADRDRLAEVEKRLAHVESVAKEIVGEEDFWQRTGGASLASSTPSGTLEFDKATDEG